MMKQKLRLKTMSLKVEIDFSTVSCTKAVYNEKRKHFHGLAFIDDEGKVIATSYFLVQLTCNNGATERIELTQLIVA